MIQTGDVVTGNLGGSYTVGSLLGSGGQGAVFNGTDASGDGIAIKWYATGFQVPQLREAISELVLRGAPSVHFLWPREVVSANGNFGYVMALRPPDFVSVPSILTRRTSVPLKNLVRAAIGTVAAFRSLQSNGLFYCDISDGNLFVGSGAGDVLICDNDNVRAPGIDPPTVWGTPRFMAPEVVRGTFPSALTDSFSMAILLFLLLMNDHPLQGAAETRIKCLDFAAMKHLYGDSPIFIFDPEDDSNRPVPGVHINAPIYWDIYTQTIRDIFTRVFTVGLRDPAARPSFNDWNRALCSLEDSMVYCTQCKRQNFVESPAWRTSCWKCDAEIRPPLGRLEFSDKRSVVLNANTTLYAHHVSKFISDPGSRSEIVAEVCRHPTEATYGLTNRSTEPWFVVPAGGAGLSLNPGRTVPIFPGTTVAIGEVTLTMSV